MCTEEEVEISSMEVEQGRYFAGKFSKKNSLFFNE
jgi:hypothetical protein